MARFARTLTKRLAAPLDGPSALGARLALIAFGIGVVEVVYTARTALAAGQRVSLLVAVQRASDAVLLPELCEAAAAAAAAASAAAPRCDPPFQVALLLSREAPSEELQLELDGLCGGGAGAARGCGVSVARGLVDQGRIGAAFGGADWGGGMAPAVGSRAQTREAYALLEAVGVLRRLLGLPILWGCW